MHVEDNRALKGSANSVIPRVKLCVGSLTVSAYLSCDADRAALPEAQREDRAATRLK